MPSPAQIYRERCERFATECDALGRRSAFVSNLRGATFGGMAIFAIVAAASDDALPWGLTSLGFAAAFGVLVVWHARVLREELEALAYRRVNDEALARATGAWRNLPRTGESFAPAGHPYAGDLDVFGKSSLFQHVCVAHTYYGQAALARLLSAPSASKDLERRQRAAQALAPQLEERQRFETMALRAAGTPLPPLRQKQRERVLDPQSLLSWLETKDERDAVASLRRLAVPLPVLTLALMTSSVVLGWPSYVWAAPLLVQIVISARVYAAGSAVFSAVTSLEGLFEQFSPMLRAIEGWRAESEWLADLQASVATKQEPASQALATFASRVAWFEARHNALFYPILNSIFLWDLNCVLALRRWKELWGSRVRTWFEAAGEMEAVSCMAGFAHDNPDFAWPELAPDTEDPVFDARGLAHPLIGADQRVANDVSVGGVQRALLVTGSNMSGKSTLLRAMGVAAVLAQAGAPVCATRLRISRLSVCTSMRVSDSLEHGVSHFYAELDKLRQVLVAARGGDRVLFLLDEILHGTNSLERQIGARWILAQLLHERAIGAVSTHDQGLCELSDEALSHAVRQVHLREQVEDGRMTFDYRLREGPVSGGNALRLMRTLGLDVPLGNARE